MKKFLFTILAIIVIIGGYVLISNNRPTTVPNVPTNMQTYSNAGIQFSYPQTFSGNVWRPLSWPPVVNIVSLTQDPIAIGCPEMKNTIQQSGTIQGQTNDGLTYSLYQGSDAGAGQLYSLYCYVVQGKSNYYVFDITIHSANGCGGGNCGPYCGTENEQECKNFDMTKDVVQPLNDMVTSLKITERLNEQAAIDTIKNTYPELKDYPSDALPPRSISTEKGDNGRYVAFIQEGSGRPIISAKCFFVDENNKVTSNGEYAPTPDEDSVQKFSAKTCAPLLTDTPQTPTTPPTPIVPTPTNQKCALETCHGLDVTCGPNPPDVCTEMYGMGDKCLKYVQCGIVNGTCQVIENASFSQCKSCVENCINTNKGDAIKGFECESNCK